MRPFRSQLISRLRLPAIAVFVSCATCLAAEQPSTKPASTGSNASGPITFDQKSPLSDPVKITKRTGWSLEQFKKQAPADYDIKGERFEVHVPADYTGDQPYGLFVWINGGSNGDIPSHWKESIDRHKLIWIGADDSGNPRPILIRMGLALDAVAGVKARYKIDDRRIYIGGASGGGKVATILGIGWPDVFTGGFYMIGSEFYRNVPTGEPDHVWPRAFAVPEPKLLKDSKQRSRHVFITGEGDMNRAPVSAFAAGYKKDGFAHVTLLDVPGLGHRPPNAEWFEKGLVALDEIPATNPTTRKSR